MKSKWMIETNVIDGKKMYRPYRMIDAAKPDHSGNREYNGSYCADRTAVRAAVEWLNEREEQTCGYETW